MYQPSSEEAQSIVEKLARVAVVAPKMVVAEVQERCCLPPKLGSSKCQQFETGCRACRIMQ